MNNANQYVCPMCMRRGLAVRIDRKGRPYLGCADCQGVIFTRGTVALANVLATVSVLDAPSVYELARGVSYTLQERPLAELLAPAASPAVAAATLETEPRAAAGGAR